MGSAATFLAQFFPLFLLGALFGKLMDDSGSVSAIAGFMRERLGERHAMLAVVLAGALVTYGGVSLFVAFFVLVPMAQEVFRAAAIPRRLMPAAIALGTSTFTMSAMPGTPSIQNAIPMPFFGTTPFAAPGLGIIASAIMLGFGLWWLARAERGARRRGEGYGAADGAPGPAAADDPIVRELATTAREFDPAEIHRGRHSETLPTIGRAALPLVVVLIVNLVMSLLVLPRLDFSFLAEEYWGATSLQAVAGVWAVMVALACAIATVVAVNWRRLPSLRASMDAGANASVLPAVSVASLVGFGAVVAALPAFDAVRDWVLVDRGRPAGVAGDRDERAGGSHRIGLGRSHHRARRAWQHLYAARGADRDQSRADAPCRRDRLRNARQPSAQRRGGDAARLVRPVAPRELSRYRHGRDRRRNHRAGRGDRIWLPVRFILEHDNPPLAHARPDEAGMTSRPALIMLGLCTTVLVLAALYFARSILAPVAFSLFVIAIVWPLQRALQARMPALVALLATLVVTLVVVTVLVGLIAWSFGTVGRWLIDNAARFQALYLQLTDWLEGHGILLTSLLVDNFNAGWLIRAVQEIGARIHGLLSFTIITFVFTVLGLLEVDIARSNIESLRNRETAQTILQSSERIADKFQKYMLVRSIMSVLTGTVVWGFALLAGLELATAWGVIAFVLNYIPFIGPLVATVFPTLFALAQFESWQLAIIVFVCLNLIQFLIGSYLEPRIAGAALALSPFLVLFAVFFWAFLWGIPGAFIGVPIVIAILTVCEQRESTRWLATLLSGGKRKAA